MTCKSEPAPTSSPKCQPHPSRGFWTAVNSRCSNSASSTRNPQVSPSLDFHQLITITRNQKSVILTPFSLVPHPAPHLLPPNWPPSSMISSLEGPLLRISVAPPWGGTSPAQDLVFLWLSHPPVHEKHISNALADGTICSSESPYWGKAHPFCMTSKDLHNLPQPNLRDSALTLFHSLLSGCSLEQPTYFHTSVPSAQDTSNLPCLANFFPSFQTQLKCTLLGGTLPGLLAIVYSRIHHCAPVQPVAQATPLPLSHQN